MKTFIVLGSTASRMRHTYFYLNRNINQKLNRISLKFFSFNFKINKVPLKLICIFKLQILKNISAKKKMYKFLYYCMNILFQWN